MIEYEDSYRFKLRKVVEGKAKELDCSSADVSRIVSKRILQDECANFLSNRYTESQLSNRGDLSKGEFDLLAKIISTIKIEQDVANKEPKDPIILSKEEVVKVILSKKGFSKSLWAGDNLVLFND